MTKMRNDRVGIASFESDDIKLLAGQ